MPNASVDWRGLRHIPGNYTLHHQQFQRIEMKVRKCMTIAAWSGSLFFCLANVAQAAEGPFGGTAAPVPGTVQAENYDTGGQGVAYNVAAVNGTDNSYRSDGVNLETTTATGGGNNLGWAKAGQWFRYTVNVAKAGTYTVTFAVASADGATDAFHLSNAAGTNLTGSVNVPNTGGWQTWTTVKASVTLSAGQQVLTLNEDNPEWNIYSAVFALAASGEGPYGGVAAAIPGTVQAENYDTGGQGIAYNATSTNGTANSYRTDGVDLQATTDTGGGDDLGWTTSGQWFKYTVNVATAGTYTVTFRVAAESAISDAFHIANSSGTNLSGSVAVPDTGGWQTWASVTATVTLPAGQQTLTFDQDTAGWNLNWFSFASASSSGGNGPFGGTPAAVPGTVQAENYDLGGQGVGYDISPNNGTDSSYRSDGVDLEATTDAGGGDDLGWTAAGQWSTYTVNVATAGTYTVTFRVASESAISDAFHIANSSGTNLSGSVTVPDTGGWQTWADVTATVTLPAGTQTLTLDQDNAGWNINWFSFTSGSSTNYTPAEILAGINARMIAANQVNTEPHINTQTGAMDVNVYQVAPGVFTYSSSMAIDDDGSDPDPDPDHQDQTTWQDSSGAQLGAHHVPYYVLGDDCWDNEKAQGGHFAVCPHFYYANWNITGLQFALIFYNGQVIGAVFGDTQGTDVTSTSDNDSRQLGEASVESAFLLGIPDSGTTGGVDSGVTVTVFSGSQWVLQGTNEGTGPVGSATGNLNGNAQALVQKALNTLGADFAQ